MTASRYRRAAAALFLAAAALSGHLWYWYLPRQHPRAAGDDAPARLLADDRFDLRLWVPYPHQNLARLAREIEEPRAYLAAATRLAGMPLPWLPGFGPFPLPPARELAAGYHSDTGVVVVAARIYPAMALVGRWAGRLVGNPWLAGGEVRVQGAAASVRWRRSLWLLEGGGARGWLETVGEASRSPPRHASLAAFAVTRPAEPLAGGLFLVRRRGSGLVFERWRGEESGEEAAEVSLPLQEADLLDQETILVLLSAGGVDHGAPAVASALALQRIGERPPGELPGAAVLFEAGAPRLELPGEKLGSLLALELHRGEAAGWSLLALDRASLGAAERLAPELRDLVAASQLRDVRLALWLEPGPLARFARHLRATLQPLPLVPGRDLERWRDVETLLAPLREHDRLSLIATRDRVSIEVHGDGEERAAD